MFTHSPSIVRSNLVLYLDAGSPKSYGGSGTTWTDISRNGNDGTLVNGVGYSNGAMVFDGVNDYGQIDKSSTQILGNNIQTLTFSFWLKYSSTAMLRACAFLRSSSSSLFGLSINESSNATSSIGALGFFTRNSSDTAHVWLISSDNYHLKNQFINVVGVVSGSDRFLYINGIQKNSDTGVGIQSVSNVVAQTYIGCGPQGPADTQKFNGNIASVQLYNRALSPAEILQNYNATKGRYGL